MVLITAIRTNIRYGDVLELKKSNRNSAIYEQSLPSFLFDLAEVNEEASAIDNENGENKILKNSSGYIYMNTNFPQFQVLGCRWQISAGGQSMSLNLQFPLNPDNSWVKISELLNTNEALKRHMDTIDNNKTNKSKTQ